MKKASHPDSVLPLIYQLRGQRVILDADLARLYGVMTKALNQAVTRHRGRFPTDFAFQLTVKEAIILRAKTETINAQDIDGELNVKQ